jgi:protease-4
LKKETGGSNRIAVIYLQGDIVDGRAGSGQIGSADAIEEIEKAAANTRVKAIVLRVNSPGGSAFASEEIWHAAMEAKKKKPLVVSMGDYAASGGYYIATAADAIYAEPATITGSIGVFGIIPIANRFFKDKMGITFDGVKTDQFADLAMPTKPMTEQEKAILQQGVNEFYATFLTRVANGRHMKENDVNEIAQGRVWVAVKAKEIGLVDRLGGLDDAIADAGKRAKLADYRIQEMPTPKGMFDKLLSEAEETVHLGAKVKEASQNPFQIIITQLNQMIGAKGVLATEYFRLSL